MKEEIYNEQELKALEDEIRALGIPYSKNEPDERYFANFRVHLMERIDAKQAKQNIFASVWSWLATSPLRVLSLGAGLAAVIAIAFLMNSSQEQKIALVQPVQQIPVATAPLPVAQPETKQQITTAPKVIVPKTVIHTDLAVKANTDKNLDAAINANDLASMDEVLTNGESEGPVNYENLSESELESVVTIVQEMN